MKNLPGLHYFTAAALVTVLMLLIYASVQQTYRNGLNDPQIQIARTVSSKLVQGRSIEPDMASDSFNINQSLLPFIVLYDAAGKALRSNAYLDGKMPQVPIAVFSAFKNDIERRITWQPRKGTRMAMVIVRTNASPVQFVASGRSMSEVEERIKQMSTMVFIAWVICLFIISFTAVINHFGRTKKVLQKQFK